MLSTKLRLYGKNLHNHKELLANSFIILACLFLSIIFPVDQNSLSQLLTKNIFFLVIVPALYIKIILKKNLSDFGLNVKNKKGGIFLGILSFIVLTSVYYLLFNYTSLPKKYALPSNIVGQFSYFMIYELFLMNILLFCYEFFYRGFVFFIFSEKLGYWAIAVQGAAAIAVFFLTNGFFWQFSAPIALSLSGGIIVYKSKSFIFSYITSLLFIIIMNSYIIYTINQ